MDFFASYLGSTGLLPGPVGSWILPASALVFVCAVWLRGARSLRQLRCAVQALEAEVGRRKTAEEHLAGVEQSLATTLAGIGAGFMVIDRGGQVRRMNRIAEQVTGWSQQEALGLPVWQVFVRDGAEAGHLRDLAAGSGGTQQVVVAARDGARTTVELQVDSSRGEDGRPDGLNLVFKDIAQIRQAQVAEHRLAAIVESSQDAIIGKTLDGRITSWNGAAQRMFGYSPEEAIGQPVQMLLPPERAAEEMRILSDLAHGRQVPAFNTIRVTKDGRPIELSVTISPIRDASGLIVGGSKIARDVSAQKMAEDAGAKALQLEAENRRIQGLTRLKSQFLANMSHELRTPLNAIIGFADLLQAGAVPVTSPKHQEYLGHIGSSGRHLLQLINDVLDLSKIEAGKLEFSPEPVDLRQLIAGAQEVLHTAAQHKRLRLEMEVDPSLAGLVFDPARFKQVLYNYLSNAIKFTRDGGCVTVRAMSEGPAHFRLEVEDTGIGIAADDLPRLFVEFQQLDAGYRKRHQGTGLGLALTRQLVQAQGGSVGVRSQPGVGSVFHLVLPRVPQGTASGSRRWLVVDRDAQVYRQTAQELAAAGYAVDGAATGQQALALAYQHAYQAIALDLVLPDQHGLETLAAIRAGGPSHETPVRAVSMPADSSDAARFAIANVLSKPIRTQEVVVAMARVPWPQGRKARVLVIDDEPLALELMHAALMGVGIDALCVEGGARGLDRIPDYQPDAIILDLMMPGMDGFAVLDALRRLPGCRDTPVFIWTSMILTDEEYADLARSARAIVNKGGGALAGVLEALRYGPVFAGEIPARETQA